MNPKLVQMINSGEVGFQDILDAYADLCIIQVRDITVDMIHDEGAAVLINQGINLSVEGLTEQAVDWAQVHVPEMIGEGGHPSTDAESWLNYVLRITVQKRVKETKAFQIKLS